MIKHCLWSSRWSVPFPRISTIVTKCSTTCLHFWELPIYMQLKLYMGKTTQFSRSKYSYVQTWPPWICTVNGAWCFCPFLPPQPKPDPYFTARYAGASGIRWIACSGSQQLTSCEIQTHNLLVGCPRPLLQVPTPHSDWGHCQCASVSMVPSPAPRVLMPTCWLSTSV